MLMTLHNKLSDYYWLNIGEEGFPFVGLIEHTNLVPKEWYGGKHVLYISNYLSTEDYYWQLGKEELLEAYIPFLQRVNPEFERSWIDSYQVFREAAAQPIVPPNYSQRIPEMQTPVKNLILANTTQIYPQDRGTNYSVDLGRKAARLALES